MTFKLASNQVEFRNSFLHTMSQVSNENVKALFGKLPKGLNEPYSETMYIEHVETGVWFGLYTSYGTWRVSTPSHACDSEKLVRELEAALDM